MMMRGMAGLAAIAALAGCATTGRPIEPAVKDAVQFGIEACERHFVEGLPMEDAVAAVARGRAFERTAKHFEQWTSDPKPWRLSEMDVWVGLTEEGEDADRCMVLALDAGSESLRDEIVAEHVARTDRTWTSWPSGGGGRRAACTTDRIPDGKSVLVVASYTALPSERWESVVASPIPSRFDVDVIHEKTCDRNS